MLLRQKLSWLLALAQGSALTLVYSTAEYFSPVWNHSTHTILADRIINSTLPITTGCLKPTPIHNLPTIAGIPPASLRRDAASLRLAKRYQDENHHHGWNVHGQNSCHLSKDSLPGVPDTQAECSKIDLSRHAWVKLNMLKTSTGRFRATAGKWQMTFYVHVG